jgi:hypothetical protein
MSLKFQSLENSLQKYNFREETEAGSPLSDIVTMGLERPKFAADCLNVVMKELKLHCQEGTPNCKVHYSNSLPKS